jgi:hypothetical protein
MKCRNCGTEIADKALVCYRCGTATTEPVYAPPPAGRSRSTSTLVVTLLALVLMVFAALFITRGAPADSSSRMVTWVFAGVAVVIVILRAYARRR